MLLSVPGKVLCIVILEIFKKAVDAKLRDEQDGSSFKRYCIDQVASLRMIVEQSIE
jgi:hypothetical protein